VLRTNDDNPQPFYAANREALTKAAAEHNQRIFPLLDRFHLLVGDDAERAVRVNSRCGALLALLGLGCEWSGECITAEQWLLQALRLVRGTQAEIGVLQDLERCRPRAAAPRRGPSRTQQVSVSRVAATTVAAKPLAKAGSGQGFRWPAFI